MYNVKNLSELLIICMFRDEDGKNIFVEKNYCEYAYTLLKHIFSSLKDATALCLMKLPVYLILSESCNIYLLNIKCEINPKYDFK